MDNFLNRVRNAYDVFRGRSPTPENMSDMKYHYSFHSGPQSFSSNLSSIVTGKTHMNPIYNQIAVDCSTIDIRHVRLSGEGIYKETINDELNYILSVGTNIDQTPRAFMRDVIISMLEEGVVALVPVETIGNPEETDAYKILSVRVGQIVDWSDQKVVVELFNSKIGRKERVVVSKKYVPIVENPFYCIMNEPNSTLKRLTSTLMEIDKLNSRYAGNRLDLILQLPYSTGHKTRAKQAEDRLKELTDQLEKSAYGVAYIDASEKITQLNRAVTNNLWDQAQALKKELYNQMGLSDAIFDGTADETAMLNYHNRTLEPILSAITDEMDRKWISETARTQNQAIRFYRDPFKLVPVANIAEIADKFTRNEIMTSNEIRSVIGMRPSEDPRADMLLNSNLNQTEESLQTRGDTIQND